MNEHEISEIRRSLSLDKNAVTAIRGCYVNAAGEIITTFRRDVALMPEEEADKYLSVFRKTLSGAPERNLLDIAFSNEQVLGTEEYQLLTNLKNSGLSDDAAVDALFGKITGAVKSEENYVILLTVNKYDVPFKGKDGNKVEDSSCETFTFLVCAVCPVRMTKTALTYRPEEKSFRHFNGDQAIGAPEIGFLFPTFDDRQTNIYNALLYSRSTNDAHEEFTDAVFRQAIRMTAGTQTETFHSTLAESLGEECRFSVVKALHEQINADLEDRKARHDPEPATVSKYEVKEVLENCGVSDEKIESFTKTYTENFGSATELTPKNALDPKKFELRTPDVVIKVAHGRTDLIETRVIDGVRYILVRANEGVELNGLNVAIDGEKPLDERKEPLA